MDGTKFDSVARRVATGLSRREALRGLMAGAVAAVAGGSAMRTAAAGEDDLARAQCRKVGELCTKTRQCCGDRVCRYPQNPSNSDFFCCGVEGGACNGSKDCCFGYKCTSKTNGKCRKRD